ncbi:MAG TPA: hypothetical protein VGK50_05310 [Coriobacteriia bacterium]|jgi:hypothetical protein
MKKHLYLTLVLGALVLTVGLALTAAVALGESGASEEAQKKMDKLAGRTVRAEVSGAPGSARGSSIRYRDLDTQDEYSFDSRGVVRTVTYRKTLESYNDLGTASLSDSELQARARDYVAAHFPEMSLEGAGKVVRRPCGVDQLGREHFDVTVEFREKYKGVDSPNFVLLNIDPASGRVGIASHDDGPVDLRTVTPVVTSSSAAATAAKKAEMPIFKVRRCDLRIIRNPRDASVSLVWDVEVFTGDEGFGASASASVDAVSGDVVAFGISG